MIKSNSSVRADHAVRNWDADSSSFWQNSKATTIFPCPLVISDGQGVKLSSDTFMTRPFHGIRETEFLNPFWQLHL